MTVRFNFKLTSSSGRLQFVACENQVSHGGRRLGTQVFDLDTSPTNDYRIPAGTLLKGGLSTTGGSVTRLVCQVLIDYTPAQVRSRAQSLAVRNTGTQEVNSYDRGGIQWVEIDLRRRVRKNSD